MEFLKTNLEQKDKKWNSWKNNLWPRWRWFPTNAKPNYRLPTNKDWSLLIKWWGSFKKWKRIINRSIAFLKINTMNWNNCLMIDLVEDRTWLPSKIFRVWLKKWTFKSKISRKRHRLPTKLSNTSICNLKITKIPIIFLVLTWPNQHSHSFPQLKVKLEMSNMGLHKKSKN